jgi:hypothetical protein
MSDGSDMSGLVRTGGAAGLSSGTLFLARLVAACLSLGFACLLVWTIATAGSPFNSELLTPWMNTTLVDYYLSCAPLYAVLYCRERSSLGGALRVLACAGLGACAVWACVLEALLRVQPGVTMADLISGRGTSF